MGVLVNGVFCQVFKRLVETTKSTHGAKVENNKYCASVHFRCVDEKVPNYILFQRPNFLNFFPLQEIILKVPFFLLFPFQYWSDLADKVKSVVKEYPMLRITQGRKVFHLPFSLSI
jgi:trehalose 6-phosphate phosphatase